MKERNNSYSYTKTHTAPMQPMPYSTRFYEGSSKHGNLGKHMSIACYIRAHYITHPIFKTSSVG